MIRIKIGNKKYKGVYLWEEMTLRKFNELASIPIPAGYEAFIVTDGKFSVDNIDQYIDEISKISDEQLNIEFPAYYRKVITCLSDIPESVEITKEQAHEIYDSYFKPFVVTLIYHVPVINFFGKLTDYTPEKITRFRIGRTNYYLPESITILDDVIPLAKEPIITYSEASDLFRGMKIGREDVNRLALFMAIYCRKKGEAYNEESTLERKDLMLGVKMSVVWAVFFCTVRRLIGSLEIIRSFGKHPQTMAENVLEARMFKSMAAGDLSMNVPDMAVTGR